MESSGSMDVLRANAVQVYSQQSRAAQEEHWILDNLPLVRHIVHRIAPKLPAEVDVDDLISAGTVGLVRAAKAFDPNKNTGFRTYAYIRVRGAVLDELRGRSFVPVAIHGRMRRIREGYQRANSQLGAPPDDVALAKASGMSLQQLYHTLQEARKQHFLSIHGLIDDAPALGGLAVSDRSPGPDALAEQNEIREQLAKAILGLPQRERLVVIMYYQRDLTMKEISQVLGITESRVSQLHAAALFKLAMKVKDDSQ